MSDLRTALESLVLYIEGQDDTHDNCRADECEVASARAALAAPDDRDREVERIAAVLSNHIATEPRHDHDEPDTWRAILRPGTYTELAAALYDAGLRASGGD